jgi:hypothetical protein
VKAYSRPHCPQRCVVRLFRKYQSLCPPNLAEDSPFYLQPLRKVKTDQWYSANAVGRNTLANIIPRMCKAAGFEGMNKLFTFSTVGNFYVTHVKIFNFY